jgi:hypothetical protein
MTVLKRIILLASLVVIIPVVLFAETGQNDRLKAVNTIIEQSGIESQFAQLPALIETQLLAQQQSMDKDKFEILSRIMKKYFTHEPIVAKVRETFMADYDEKSVNEILLFYESDLAKKMTAFEIQASGPDIYEKIQKLDFYTIDNKRKAQIEKLIKEIESLEFEGLIAAATFEGFIKSINAILPDNKKIPDDKINEIKKKTLAAVNTEEQKIFQIKFYYLTYEKASDAELSQYIAFYSTKPGKWMHTKIRSGMLKGINVCSENAGKDLAEVFLKNK